MNEQLDIFSFVKPKFKFNKPIRLIETFAGIGSQAKALKNLGARFEHWKVIEFDQHAIDSYNAIHKTNFATQDITQTHAQDLEIIDRESYCYVLTYSFPCQDLSLAGNQKGMAKGSGTRSGLLWEVERILDECNGNLPQVLLMENVPQVIGQKNIKDFNQWTSKLEQLGYSNYIQILNAKDYGIPQNRKRCFMVSILGEYHYEFPKKQKLELRLKDMLEDNVDNKYYVSEKMMAYLTSVSKGGINRKEIFERNLKRTNYDGITPTLTTNEGSRATDIYVSDGLLIKNKTNKGFLIANDGDGVDISKRMEHHRGTVQKGICQTLKTQQDVGVCVIGNYMPSGHEASRIVDSDGLAPTIKENYGTVNATNEGLRIRKLTPKECYRLMGFTDQDYEAARLVNSESQLYKQAGNSIVVNVLEAIFKEML